MRALVIAAFCALSLTGLSACGGGWKLKGYEAEKAQANAAPLAILVQGVSLNSAFGEALKSVARQRGSRLVKDSAAAEVVVQASYKEDRIVSGYSASRAVREFDHQAEITFTATHGEKVVKDTIFRSQIQTYDSEYVLGTQEESDTIKRNLRQEVARALLNRLAAI